jgi:hypothetical protein
LLIYAQALQLVQHGIDQVFFVLLEPRLRIFFSGTHPARLVIDQFHVPPVVIAHP